MLYNFPRDQFDEFKLFINEENILMLIFLMEQLSAELMWKKLLQKKFSSKIVISQQEIEKILNDEKKNKVNTNIILQRFFENKTNNDWSESEKKD